MICKTCLFLLVDCKPEFELTPEKGVVTGIIGRNVTLQWNIIKEKDTDKFMTASLILIGSTQKTLYTLDPTTQKSLPAYAEKTFDDRISSEIKDGKTYLLTLKKLKYNDTNSFELRILTIRGGFLSNQKTAVIRLIVEGMNYMIIYQIVSGVHDFI